MIRTDINRLLRARPVSARYGAPLGARDTVDPPYPPTHCQRVRFVDGDYGPDGTYWGGGRDVLPIYAVFSAGLETLCYYRAASRADAIAAHNARYKGDPFRGRA